jgi:hypothetical protein
VLPLILDGRRQRLAAQPKDPCVVIFRCQAHPPTPPALYIPQGEKKEEQLLLRLYKMM